MNPKVLVAVAVKNARNMDIYTYEVDWPAPIVSMEEVRMLKEDLRARFMEIQTADLATIVSWQRFEEWPSSS